MILLLGLGLHRAYWSSLACGKDHCATYSMVPWPAVSAAQIIGAHCVKYQRHQQNKKRTRVRCSILSSNSGSSSLFDSSAGLFPQIGASDCNFKPLGYEKNTCREMSVYLSPVRNGRGFHFHEFHWETLISTSLQSALVLKGVLFKEVHGHFGYKLWSFPWLSKDIMRTQVLIVIYNTARIVIWHIFKFSN